MRLRINYYYDLAFSEEDYFGRGFRREYHIKLDSTDVDTLVIDKEAGRDAQVFYNGILQASIPIADRASYELRVKK